MADSTIFETCSTKFSTDELDSLLSCISDGHQMVSGSPSLENMTTGTRQRPVASAENLLFVVYP